MSRLDLLHVHDLTPAARAAHDEIVAGPRDKVEGPLWVWLRSPELARVAAAYGAFCRFETKVPRKLCELSILMTSACWKADFEWAVHEPAALSAGWRPDQIAALKQSDKPNGMTKEEEIVYRFCRGLIYERKASDETYTALVNALGEEIAVELVGVLGYYSLVSLTCVAFEVPVTDESMGLSMRAQQEHK